VLLTPLTPLPQNVQVRMLADTHRAATDALGLALPDTLAPLGSVRCRRFSAVVVDNRVVALNVEPPGGMACSLSSSILAQLHAAAATAKATPSAL
jgi:peroxiredoxin